VSKKEGRPPLGHREERHEHHHEPSKPNEEVALEVHILRHVEASHKLIAELRRELDDTQSQIDRTLSLLIEIKLALSKLGVPFAVGIKIEKCG
jgi:hypothetical protein